MRELIQMKTNPVEICLECKGSGKIYMHIEKRLDSTQKLFKFFKECSACGGYGHTDKIISEDFKK